VKRALNIETHDWVKKAVNLNSLFFDYFGINAEKYVKAQEYFQSHAGKLFWNWSAALLGPIWLFYRKMYTLLFIWLFIAVCLDFVYFASPLLDSDLTNPLLKIVADYYGLITLFFILVTNVGLGCWGTYYYLQQAEHMVDFVRASTPNTIAAVILSEKGNPSKWRLAGGILLFCATYFMTYLSAYLWLILR